MPELLGSHPGVPAIFHFTENDAAAGDDQLKRAPFGVMLLTLRVVGSHCPNTIFIKVLIIIRVIIFFMSIYINMQIYEINNYDFRLILW